MSFNTKNKHYQLLSLIVTDSYFESSPGLNCEWFTLSNWLFCSLYQFITPIPTFATLIFLWNLCTIS